MMMVRFPGVFLNNLHGTDPRPFCSLSQTKSSFTRYYAQAAMARPPRSNYAMCLSWLVVLARSDKWWSAELCTHLEVTTNGGAGIHCTTI
jgi:hypothetical protein